VLSTSFSSKLFNFLVRGQCQLNPHAFHGRHIFTQSKALTKVISASSLNRSILSIIACPHLSSQKQTHKKCWTWIFRVNLGIIYSLKFTYSFCWYHSNKKWLIRSLLLRIVCASVNSKYVFNFTAHFAHFYRVQENDIIYSRLCRKIKTNVLARS